MVKKTVKHEKKCTASETSQMVVDPTTQRYLLSKFNSKTFFGVWDLEEVLKDVQIINSQAQHTCLYIAGKMAKNNRVQCKVQFCADPAKIIAFHNSRKRVRDNNKDDSQCQEGWKIMAFVVINSEAFTKEELITILAECTEARRLHERIKRLMNFSFTYNLDMRFYEDIIREGCRWYMPQVRKFLNEQPDFIDYISNKMEY